MPFLNVGIPSVHIYSHPHRASKVAPSVLCDVVSVVTEFMVSNLIETSGGLIMSVKPSVLCDVISVVTEFMVEWEGLPIGLQGIVPSVLDAIYSAHR
jgi:hypothetical protein